MIELQRPDRERCVIVGVSARLNVRTGTHTEGSSKPARLTSKEELADLLDELALLADTAGAEVVARITQDRDRLDPATFIGKGKVEELRSLVKENNIPLVIFDDDLTAVQVRNLERILECKVLDRSALILDIFASRAKTMEAKTQVELAQLQYLLPRLTRQWTHLSKQYGGIGTKGPGETQIETDRRMIKARIGHLKERLARIGQQRLTQRKGRTKYTRGALIGYTNVGKSTLLNLLSGSDVFVENRLFATLDPTTRIVPLSQGVQILMTDTVGFIRKLPTQLVASFKSTLEEITQADFLLHVVDVSSRRFEEQISTVQETVEELRSGDKPVLMVFNKIDRLTDRSILRELAQTYSPAVFISAARGINILGLKEEILKLLASSFVEETFRVGQDNQRLISYLHESGEVLEKQYEDNSVILKVRIRKQERERVLQWTAQHQIPEPDGTLYKEN
ncbi:MAG TPA: GTPase HflX [Bacteroidota bacterium]|nr:GTPase HflX [Bacteroidota bacterium]